MLRVSGSLLPSELYGLHAGFFSTTGRADPLLYPPGSPAFAGDPFDTPPDKQNTDSPAVYISREACSSSAGGTGRRRPN